MYAQTFLEKLDLERLHKILESPKGHRGEGRTMGFLARMVGEADVGTGFRYLYIGENVHFCKILMREFIDILTVYQIPARLNKGRMAVVVERDGFETYFEFVSIRRYSRNTLDGMYLDDLWIDLSPETKYDPRHREFIDRARSHIRMESR